MSFWCWYGKCHREIRRYGMVLCIHFLMEMTMNKTLLASAIALAFSSAVALANPVNSGGQNSATGGAGGEATAENPGGHGGSATVNQTATAKSKQDDNNGSMVNESANATTTTTTTKNDNDTITKTSTKTSTKNVTKDSNNTKTITKNDNDTKTITNAHNTLDSYNTTTTDSHNKGSFNVVAMSKLSATVSGNTVKHIGNVIKDGGINNANGGNGGNGGKGGKGGSAHSNGTANGGQGTSG